MIVKNGAATIRACLESVAGVVDQIVIADTGCTDNTCEIAREFGAEILSFPWQNHFSDARNAAIAEATTDWVLVLDADEELGAEAKDLLPALLSADGVGGYMVPIWEYLPSFVASAWTYTLRPNDFEQERARDAASYLVNTLCRLFRRRSDIYFTGRVHEIVLPQVEETGLMVGTAPFRIHHYGHLAQSTEIARKRFFYNDLLQKKLADDGNDPTTLTMCGLDEWEIYHRPVEALRYFKRALEQEIYSLETWLLMAKVFCGVHRYEEALGALDVVRFDTKYANLHFTLRGDALAALGRPSEAHIAYGRALESNPNDRLVQSKREYLELDLGDAGAAIERLKLASADLPLSVEIHELLVNACIRTGRIAEAADEAERFMLIDRREAFLLRPAKLRAQLKQWARAEPMARECSALYPASPEAAELLLLVLVGSGQLAEAAEQAGRLTLLGGEASSFARAAGLYAHIGDLSNARETLQRGLELFPESTRLQRARAEVGLSQDASGRMGEEALVRL